MGTPNAESQERSRNIIGTHLQCFLTSEVPQEFARSPSPVSSCLNQVECLDFLPEDCLRGVGRRWRTGRGRPSLQLPGGSTVRIRARALLAKTASLGADDHGQCCSLYILAITMWNLAEAPQRGA